jgi:hypothetical protein
MRHSDGRHAARLTARSLALFAALLLTGAAAPGYLDPLALVTAIYRGYVNDNNPPGPAVPYSLRLQGLIDADAKATPPGEAGRLDWDVFVNGNDFELSHLKISLVSATTARAQIRADFDNHKRPQNIRIDLVRESGAWRIDEVRSTRPGARWTMSKILKGAPDAFPDEKKK